MAKKINIKKAVDFIKEEHYDIYQYFIFMPFDDNETTDVIDLDEKSINDALKVHDQVFIELGLLYHDPYEASDEFVIYGSDEDIYLELDFGEDYEGYYGKYAFLRGGYGVFINKDYTADYGYFTSEAYGHGMGSYEYYNFNDIEDWDEVKIALTKVIDELDIWE